jgi:hypothetical protein
MTDINALGQAIDSTWGRSSTPRTASYSVKFTFVGSDKLMASYNTIVNFVSEKEMILTKRSCQEESDTVISSHVEEVRKTYKEITGETLSIKEQKGSSSDSLEIINFNVHNPKRTAYFRRKVIFEIG